MRRYIWQWALILTLSTVASVAKSSPHKKTQGTASATRSPPHPEQEPKTSEEIRATKIVGIEALYTPLSDFGLMYGGRAFYEVSANLQAGVTYLGGFLDLKNKLSDVSTAHVDKATVTGWAVFGYARYFPFNSFSVTSGLGYRSATAALGISSSNSYYVSGTFTANTVVIPVAVGNHWTFGPGIVVGCDWVVGFIPVYSSSSATAGSNLGDSATNSIYSSFTDLGKSISKSFSLTFALVSVG